MAVNLDRVAVEIDASVTGTKDVAALNKEIMAAAGATDNLAIATAGLDKQQKSFLNTLAKQNATYGMSKSGVLEYRAALLGVPEAAAPLISSLKQMGIDGEHSFAGMITQGGAFREILVLLHESLIMGNWSRFGGSLMVLSERMELAPMLFTALGAAAAASVAGLAAWGAALVMGEQESTRFAESMTLTGGMAGITEGQFRTMAATLASEVPGAATKGRNALMDLIATGQFSGDTLMAVARAATELASYSGQSAADVIKSFDDMKGNAAGWAEKMNESYHFLTEAQYEYIEQLQSQGETEKAAQAASNDLSQALTGQAQNLGILERAWNGLRSTIQGAFTDMEDIGRVSTPEQQLAAQISSDQRGRAGRGRLPVDFNTDPVVMQLRKQIADQQKAAAAKSQSDQVQQLGMSANDNLRTMTADLIPGPDIVKAKIAELKKTISEALAADPHNQQALADQAMLPTLEASIQKKYGNRNMPSAPAALNKPDINGYVIGKDDPAKLSNQLTLMQQYASATKTGEQAVLALEIAQGKLKGFTDKEIAELRTDAQNDDKLAAARRTADADQKFSDTMGGLKDQYTDLSTQVAQMKSYGDVTKTAEQNVINLQIAQGKFAGLTDPQIAALRQAAAGIDLKNSQLSDYNRSAIGGTKAAFSDWVSQATDSGSQIKAIWNDTFNGMTDVMVAALTGGKLNFDQFASSIVDDLLKMEIQVNILGPLIAALGSAGTSGGGSSLLGDIVGGIAGAFAPGAGAGATIAGTASDTSLGATEVGAMFANGGIMTSRGSLPLNRYAGGGVADSPQIAMFGEGRGPEAYVPLPDGRSIPVSMKGGAGGGGGQVVNNFHIHQDGSTSGDPVKSANAMSRAVIFAIQQEMIRQKRDGGLLSATSGA